MRNLLWMNNLSIMFLFLITASAQPYKTLLAPLKKDTKTSLYTITLNFHDRYVVDLSAPFSWRNCPNSHRYSPIPCFTSECFKATYLPSPSCSLINDAALEEEPCICMVTPTNPVTKTCASSQLTSTNLTISWTDGANPKSAVTSNNMYLSCAPPSLLRSFPSRVVGMASLSRAPLSLPLQFSTSLGVSKKFAMCLPSTSSSNGVVFFGDGPYNLLPSTSFDASSLLSYTPLLINPKSADLSIGIRALSVSGVSIPMSPFEGVLLSTTLPYTTLRTDVFEVFVNAFMKGMKEIRQVKKVKPFSMCFNASEIGYSRVGLHVPQIDMEFADGKNWTIYGGNSMKQVGGDTACLAFLDGGETALMKMVIGSFQMEDNLLQFDLDQLRLGYSSSLLFERITCSNFNFSTNA